MCLAIFAIDVRDDWPLIVLANRDEFHARPTQSMQPWADAPEILAGRDLQAGGTWLGIDTRARLALLTNVRDPKNVKHNAPSRGKLAETFLRGNQSAQAYLKALAPDAMRYNGFNLVLIDADQRKWHASNYQEPLSATLPTGVHGLSNALFDTPWPKTERTKLALANYLSRADTLQPDALCDIMLDTAPVDDALLPNTGLSLSRERLLGTPFIVSQEYGTRCTTLVLRHRSGRCWVQEDTYDSAGKRSRRTCWQLMPGQGWQLTEREPGSLNTC